MIWSAYDYIYIEFKNRWKQAIIEIRAVVSEGGFLEKVMRHLSEVMEVGYILIGVV